MGTSGDVDEHLEASQLLFAICVEGDVHGVGGGHQSHPTRGQLGAAHLDTKVLLESFNLHIILRALLSVLHLQRLEGQKNVGSRRTRDAEVAVIVGRVERGVVWRGEGGDALLCRQCDVLTRHRGRWCGGCCRCGGCPEYSTEAELEVRVMRR